MSSVCRATFVLTFLCLLVLVSACTVSTPYQSLERGEASPEGEEVLLVITHAVVDSSQRRAFDRNTRRVRRQLAQQPGLLAYSLRLEVPGSQAWTMTVWESEEARARFATSELHLQAIRESAPATKQVRTLRRSINRSELPMDWRRALALLEANETQP